MAYWDSDKQKTIHIPPRQSEHYPGWGVIDCGCCGGLEWGGLEPRECGYCNGGGVYYKHRKSGVCAEYPGGRFVCN